MNNETDLPRWDLRHLYAHCDDPQYQSDIETARQKAREFQKQHQGQLADYRGKKLGDTIAEYEMIEELLGKISAYAYLYYSEDVSDAQRGRFLQKTQEEMAEIGGVLLFFTLELNTLDDKALSDKLTDPALQKYAPWLEDLRVFRAYQLEEKLEKLLLDKSVSGRNGWVRLFDETHAQLRFPIQNQDMTSTQAFDCLSKKDPALRREAAGVISKVLQGEARLLTLITNNLAKDKAIEDKWRGLPQPWTSRNLANLVEDEVVDALLEAVEESYPRLSHRYYALKAQMLARQGGASEKKSQEKNQKKNQDAIQTENKMAWWDRNAPLPQDDDSEIPWAEAKNLVLSSYQEFSPEMGKIAQRFFAENWIDAPPTPGKASGAYAHPVTPCVHPYILLNYQGKARDVMTLAHEMGHGIHQVLAASQGYLLSQTPLTLAETASVFGEMLSFQKLLMRMADPVQRAVLQARKIEDMLNTVVRQIAFYRFERQLHVARRKAELSGEDIHAIWLETQRAALGPAIHLDDDYGVFWSYIPHFIHSPFYVYAYAFGDCLVNALYAHYQEHPNGFEAKYLDLLRAGGSQRHKELLAPFGLDASRRDFWRTGLDMIAGMIDDLAQSPLCGGATPPHLRSGG